LFSSLADDQSSILSVCRKTNNLDREQTGRERFKEKESLQNEDPLEREKSQTQIQVE